MDIKELLGDAYKEGMTIEEINTALADKNFVDPSTLPKSVSKELYDKTSSELAKYKKENEDLKSASLTDNEKLQKALGDAETARLDFIKKSVRLDVEKVFVDGGLTEDEYKDIIDGIVTADSEASVAMAKNIVSVIAAKETAKEKTVKAKLLEGTPKPPAGKGSEGMTIDKFKQLSPQDRLKFSQENPDEYKKLYGGNH